MDAISPLPALPAQDDSLAALQAFPTMKRLDHGLYAVRVAALGEPIDDARMTLPCLHVTSPPSPLFDPVDIMTAWNDQGAWIGPEGGTVMLRVLPGGGQILVTLYGDHAARASLLDRLAVHCIDDLPATQAPATPGAAPELPAEAAGAPPEPSAMADQAGADQAGADQAQAEPTEPDAPAAEAPPARLLPRAPGEVDIEIVLHVQRFGDAAFPGGAWCGNIGQRHQVEAFGLRSIDAEMSVRFEYMAFGPAGRETSWVSDGKLCGTRGRGMPLTGFAIRVAEPAQDEFDVTYQGAFFDSGVTKPCSNGDACLPPLADDCLEAIHVQVVRRSAEG